MKRFKFNHAIIIILIALSVIFFVLQLLIFHRAEESEFLIFQDLGFLPLEILLVTFILDRILRNREKQEKLQQIHIVISSFFSEIGTNALREIGLSVVNRQEIAKELDMQPGWTEKEFTDAANTVRRFVFHSAPDAQVLEGMRTTLSDKKAQLIQLFSNPNLLEHEPFTDMLWSLYHVMDELENREDFSTLPASDINHLAGDITRAYGLLVYEWIFYMKYLKRRYPYLWSIAARKNPYTDNSIVVAE